MPFQPSDGPLWHALHEDEALRLLDSRREGLTEAEARERRRRFGLNALPRKPRLTLAAIVLHQFLSPLIYILIGAGLLSLAIGDAADAGFIFFVIFFNASLGAYQEWKAERSAEALQGMMCVMARLRRESAEIEVPAEALVPGDIVLLESGFRVPADMRLLSARNLRVDESLLTGESKAVEKHHRAMGEGAPSLGDRLCMAYAGSTVMTGRGLGVVTATGLRSEVGKIAGAVARPDLTPPPLVIRMQRFVRHISIAILGAVALVAALSWLRGAGLMEIFFLAVALAVSAIPEGLPVAMTVAMAIGVTRMARRGVIVRRMTAVEGLGSCTYIASDKTGTLTVNMQTVRALVLPDGTRLEVTGEGYNAAGEIRGPAPEAARRLALAGLLCNEGGLSFHEGEWRHYGDAVDVSLLALAMKEGFHPDGEKTRRPSAGEVPFESERRYAAQFYREGGTVRVAVKGAPETLLTMCRPAPDAAVLEKAMEALSEEGFRVLALAEGVLEGDSKAEYGEADLPPLRFLGLAAMIDPPRPEAREAVEKCRNAGIEVAMVTGDHPVTALAIARAVGIASDMSEVISGAALAALGGPGLPAFAGAVRTAKVFARVSPLQKLQIVDALVAQGHFVAVTGDGVNDAPAIRAAHIGVAMGSGTDVAKDTASIIVADDRFSSIVAGVEQGRQTYDNIRKVMYLLVSTGAAEIVIFGFALAFHAPLPLLAVHLLWLNLVTNGIQDIALAFERGEPDVMRRPPKPPGEGVFNALMVRQCLLSGAVMGIGAYALWHFLLATGFDEAGARNKVLLLMVLFENFHVFNCRSERISAFRVPIRRNLVLLFGVSGALGLHVLAMHAALMQRVLKVQPVSMREFAFLALLASTVLLAMEVFKRARRKNSASAAW